MNRIARLSLLVMVLATHGCVAKAGNATLTAKRGCCAKGSSKQNIVVIEKTGVIAKSKPWRGPKTGSVIQAAANIRDAGVTRPGTKMNERKDVVSLADSLNPLREHFNANMGKARFIALLSPT